MHKDKALLPPRIETLARVAALEAHKALRLDRLLDADRRLVYEEVFPFEPEHDAPTIPFEDVPRFVAILSDEIFGYDAPTITACFNEDRDEAVHEMLELIDSRGWGTPVRDHRVEENADRPLACLDLDTGEWLHFRRSSLVQWEQSAPALDLPEAITFDPFPDTTATRPAPAWPETVALTESEAARIRDAEHAWKAAQTEAREIGDACIRAALARDGVTVHPVYLTRHRGSNVAREVPLRFEVDIVDAHNDTHIAYVSMRCVGGRLLRSGLCLAGLTAADAVLTKHDLSAVASVLNLPLYVEPSLFRGDDDGDSEGGEYDVSPLRYGRAGNDGLAFDTVKVAVGEAPTWSIRWEAGTPPAGVWRRIAAVLEAKGVPVTPTAGGLHVAMVYRPATDDA